MKRISGVLLTCLAVLPPCMLTACSEPETHVAKINLVNDLGSQAQLELCKDDLHCASISELWPAKTLAEKESRPFVVSTEETTVFKVTYPSDGKPSVRCLRVRPAKSQQVSDDVLLSTAAGC
jgi:hypothetical protein